MIRWRVDPGRIEVVDDAVAEVLRRKTPAQRVAMIFAANRTMRLRLEAALRSRYPDRSIEWVDREDVKGWAEELGASEKWYAILARLRR